MVYEVEFVDGSSQMLAANVIAENMLSQIDDEGQRQMLLDGIVDHQTLQDAIPKSQGAYVDANGRKSRMNQPLHGGFHMSWRSRKGY